MYNSAYSNLSSQYKPREYKLDLDTVGKIADYKSAVFEQAYNQISQLQASALNLQSYNATAQNKIKGYNDQIANFFKGNDLKNVDLNNGEIAKQYKDVFNGINNDAELKNYYKHEQEQKAVMQTYADAAKNPAKTGYNQSNHIVWMHENWKPMTESSNLTEATKYSGSYLPGYDVRKDLDAVKANLKFNGTSYEITDPKTGVKQSISKEELSSSRVQGYLRNIGLSQQAMNQLANDSKASTYAQWESLTPEDRTKMISVRKEQEDILIDEQITQSANQKAYNEEIIKVSKDKPEYAERVQRLMADNASYDANIAMLKSQKGEAYPTDKFAYANRVANYDVSRRVKNMGDFMAYSVEKHKTSMDPVIAYNRKYEMEMAKTQSTLATQEMQRQKIAFDMQTKQNETTTTTTDAAGNKVTKTTKDGSGIIGEVPGQSGKLHTMMDLAGKKKVLRDEIDMINNFMKIHTYNDEVKRTIQASLNKSEKESNTPFDLAVARASNTAKGNYQEIQRILKDGFSNGEFDDYLTAQESELAVVSDVINQAYDKYKDKNLPAEPTKEAKEQRLRELSNNDAFWGTMDKYVQEGMAAKMNPGLVMKLGDKSALVEAMVKKAIISGTTKEETDLAALKQTAISSGITVSPEGAVYYPDTNQLEFKTVNSDKVETNHTITVPMESRGSFPQNNPLDATYNSQGGQLVHKWRRGGILQYSLELKSVKGSGTEKTFKITETNTLTGTTRSVDSNSPQINGQRLTELPSEIVQRFRDPVNLQSFFPPIK